VRHKRKKHAIGWIIGQIFGKAALKSETTFAMVQWRLVRYSKGVERQQRVF
jgi:hypothetical protein